MTEDSVVGGAVDLGEQRFDAIVSGLYGAATGESSWNDALLGVLQAFQARVAVLQTVDMASGRMLAIHYAGDEIEDAMLTYVREYQTLDPRRQYALSLGLEAVGQWRHCHETFDERFVARDPFYQHYLAAYGTRFNSNVMFTTGETVAHGFALELPASRGVLNPDEREFARRLGLHVNEALRAHDQVRRLTAQALAGHALLRAFPYPMWLLDEDRRIHFANPPAETAMTAESTFASAGAYLMVRRPFLDSRLTEQLRKLASCAHGTTAVLSLGNRTGGPPTWLHLSTVIPEAVMGCFGQRTLVLATCFDPGSVRSLDPRAIAAMLGLTPAQARVAVHLADGHTAEQISIAQGCATATVRTHIRGVLERLGTNRITHVVKLLRQAEPLWATMPTEG